MQEALLPSRESTLNLDPPGNPKLPPSSVRKWGAGNRSWPVVKQEQTEEERYILTNNNKDWRKKIKADFHLQKVGRKQEIGEDVQS
jgi:hypothetical protein